MTNPSVEGSSPTPVDDLRGSGRSTRLALDTILEAMRFEGAVKIADHHGTPEADRHLEQIILRMLYQLGLGGFSIARRRKGSYLSCHWKGKDKP